MKKYICVLNILIILFFFANNTYSRQIIWEEIIPVNYLNKIKVTYKNKQKIYYSFNINKKISFKVLGPTIVRIYSKRLLTNKSIPNVQCLLLKNNKVIKKIDLNKIIDKKSIIKNSKSLLSKENIIELNVPADKQQYTLKLLNKNEIVLVYVSFQKQTGKEKKYVYLSPDKYLNTVIVKQKDIELTYFKTVFKKDIVFDLIGPVEVTLISRAVFTNKINNKTIYSYSVFANKSKIKDKTFKILEDKSAKIVTTPKHNPKISKIKTFTFKLPAGSFRIEIKSQPKGLPIIFRVKMPQKYVKNTSPK